MLSDSKGSLLAEVSALGGLKFMLDSYWVRLPSLPPTGNTLFGAVCTAA